MALEGEDSAWRLYGEPPAGADNEPAAPPLGALLKLVKPSVTNHYEGERGAEREIPRRARVTKSIIFSRNRLRGRRIPESCASETRGASRTADARGHTRQGPGTGTAQ